MRRLGGYVGRCWRQVGCKLVYLGRFKRQVGTFLARCWDKDAEDEPRYANLGGKKWLQGGTRRAIRGARVQPSGTRRSPRTRFLDLKVLKIGSTGRSKHQILHAHGQGPADLIASRSPPGRASSVREVMKKTKKQAKTKTNTTKHNIAQNGQTS